MLLIIIFNLYIVSTKYRREVMDMVLH